MRPEEYEGEMIDPRCDKCGKPGSHICAPSARELLDSYRDGFSVSVAPRELASRVEKVLRHHLPSLGMEYCIGCDSQWPCPTVRALNGEE